MRRYTPHNGSSMAMGKKTKYGTEPTEISNNDKTRNLYGTLNSTQ